MVLSSFSLPSISVSVLHSSHHPSSQTLNHFSQPIADQMTDFWSVFLLNLFHSFFIFILTFLIIKCLPICPKLSYTLTDIEQGPPSTNKGKMPHSGSSSVPLRIRDLKERMESTPKASRRPKEPNSVNYMKGQHSERNQMFDASAGSLKDSSDNLKKKGKSVSHAIQAKVNVQRREEFTSSSIKGSINQKEGNEVKMGQFKKNQTNVQKVAPRRTSMGRTSDVLRQNNQKQNCVANKDKVASKSSVSNQQNIKFAPSSNEVKMGQFKKNQTNVQKEGNEVKMGQFKKNQTNVQKVAQKRTSMGRTSDGLRQNNQKQNCVANKDRVASKASVSNQQNIKFAPSSNGSIGPNKVKNSAIGSRKMNSVAKDSGKELQSSKSSNEVKMRQFKKNQTNVQKVAQKRTSMGRTSDVLRQNNQKQNCVANKDRVASKASVSNQQNIKFAPSSNGSIAPNKVKNSAIGSRKMNSVAKDSGKELQSSKPKIFSGKKQPVHKDINFQKIVAKNVVSDKDQRSVRCNVASDGCMNRDTVDRQSSMDVSLTCTSPNKRSAPGLTSSAPLMEKNTRFLVDSSDDNDPNELKKSTSLGLNVIGGDALSVLLELKLKELTCRVESSQCNLVEAGSAACSALGLQDSLFTLNVRNTASPKRENSFQLNLHEDKSSRLYDIDCSSVDMLLKANQKCQGLEELEGHSSSSNNSGRGKELDCQYPSPVSSLEPSSSGGSCCSSDSKTSSITNGKSSNQSLLAKRLPVEVETELSDSASSTLAPSTSGNDVTATTFSLIDFKRSSKWELEFITKALCNAELILDDFVLGQVNNVMTPNLFDQLENQETGFDEDAEQDCFNLGRKVLFDCVSECLELRCERLFGGSFKASVKWATLFQRKEWLAEELHKEISSWASMGDLTVDELVDKDMSCWHGRWVDFETEAFEEGVEIEKGILTSLVDELVVDLFFI